MNNGMLTENFRQGIDFRINYQQEIYHGEITMPFSCNVYTKIRSEISENVYAEWNPTYNSEIKSPRITLNENNNIQNNDIGYTRLTSYVLTTSQKKRQVNTCPS